MRAVLALSLACLLPASAFAAGSGSDTPPVKSPTSETCADGQVWDADSKSCVAATDARLDDDDRLQAVRELAHFGAPAAASRVLDAMTDQNADMVLTYRGFVARQLGQRDAAFFAYARALAQNPDNLLARSYLGQAHVADGALDPARVQLAQIRQRGGRGTWAELSLRRAIRTGAGFSY